MKKIILSTIFVLVLCSVPIHVFAQAPLSERLSGKILLQVESYGRAWYVCPSNLHRYYLRDGNAAYEIMRTLSLGITNEDIARIPTSPGEFSDRALVEQLKGMILLQVEENGEAWYVNPTDGLRYYLRNGDVAYHIMRSMSLGISDANLAQIPMNNEQVVSAYTFNTTAFAHQKGNEFYAGEYENEILPLASLTKLMTALVLLDLQPNWDKFVTLDERQIRYPYEYVGDDATSEVDLQMGDTLAYGDLFIAMLIASSNQSAVALVDFSGISREEFVAKMNQKSEQFGLTKTVFYDVAGLDSHNVSTAKEFAIIAQQAFTHPKVLEVNAKNHYSAVVNNHILGLRHVNITNRNYSLLKYEPNASKTGYLVEAQRNVALRKGENILVILHAMSMHQRNTIIEKILKER